jgi:hypothetical protein
MPHLREKETESEMGLSDTSSPSLGSAVGPETVTDTTAAPVVWRRSRRCSTNACVEIADLSDGGVAVRDSKQPSSDPVLRFSAQEWQAFIMAVYAGEFG